MTRNYWFSTTIHQEVHRNTTIAEADDGWTVAYRHLLPKDAPADADPTTTGMAGTITGLGRYEMRILALEMWRASFPDPLPNVEGDDSWRFDRARTNHKDLVERFLDTAEQVMDVRPYWDSSFSDPIDDWSSRVVKAATTNHAGNLHLSSFLSAASDARPAADRYASEVGADA